MQIQITPPPVTQDIRFRKDGEIDRRSFKKMGPVKSNHPWKKAWSINRMREMKDTKTV